jgi:hypothetical protein
MNEYLPYQFSGLNVQATADSWVAEFGKYDAPLNFFSNLSIDTADEYWIEKIGEWVGFKRPYISQITLNDNAFLFGSTPHAINTNHGFGSPDGLTGGLWSDQSTDVLLPFPIALYKKLLKAFARIKYNGLSIESIDYTANVFSTNYTIDWIDYTDNPLLTESGSLELLDENETDYLITEPNGTISAFDVSLIFNDNIGAANLYAIQLVFDAVCTFPKVICSIGA